jgi:hypothetical protein
MPASEVDQLLADAREVLTRVGCPLDDGDDVVLVNSWLSGRMLGCMGEAKDRREQRKRDKEGNDVE